MNLGKTSYYLKDDDYNETFFYDGIGIVDITVDPHFEITSEEQVNEAERSSNKKQIIGLPDSSAIRIEGNNITYINK